MNAVRPKTPHAPASTASVLHSESYSWGASAGGGSGQAKSLHRQKVGAVAQVSRATSVAPPTCRKTNPLGTPAPPRFPPASSRASMAAIAPPTRDSRAARSMSPSVATESRLPAGSTRTAVTPGCACRKLTRSSIQATGCARSVMREFLDFASAFKAQIQLHCGVHNSLLVGLNLNYDRPPR